MAPRADGGGAARGPDAQVARSYQRQLLDAAKARNVVAYLETGAGKTLVAAMLIRDELDAVVARGARHRVAVFVVDRVPLAVQQADYVRGFLGDAHPVGLYYSGAGVDSWGEDRWVRAFRGKRALFFTAQTLLNALRHDVLHFEDIALLVFDEAHHATKSHPFAVIMREFYWPAAAAAQQLPRIFGMSASPVKVKRGSKLVYCRSAMDELQLILNAEVVAVSDKQQAEVNTAVAKAQEFVVEYENPLHESGTEHSLDELEPANAKQIIAHQLGACAVSIWDCEQRKTSALHEEDGVVSKKVECLAATLVSECTTWATAGEAGVPFRCIVFVERRIVAGVLTKLLNLLLESCGTEALKARSIVGANANGNSNGWDGMRMTQSQMLNTIADFHAGVFGILVSTNVVEEGLDVPACSLVVMFDGVSLARSYIQSRGRARHRLSKYVILLPKYGEEATAAFRNLSSAREGASAMKQSIEKLSEGPQVVQLVRDGTQTAVSRAAFARRMILSTMQADDEEPMLRSRTTKAVMSAAAALTVLYEFCASLPKDKYIVTSKVVNPVYDVTGTWTFVCTVTLPVNSPVSRGVCTVPQQTKVLAKRLAALDACRELYECGALDEHLFPKDYMSRYRNPATASFCGDVDPSQGEKRREDAKQKFPTREVACIVSQPKELVWTVSSVDAGQRIQGHLYKICVDQSCQGVQEMPCPIVDPHGLILQSPLKPEDLKVFVPPKNVALFSLQYVGEISMSDEEDKIASTFARLARVVACERIGGCPMEYEKRRAREEIEVRQNGGWHPGFLLVPLEIKSGKKPAPAWTSMKNAVRFLSTKNRRSSLVSKPGSIRAPRDWDDDSAWGLEIDNVEHAIVQSLHDSDGRLYFTESYSKDIKLRSSCKEIVGGGQYETFEDYYRERFEITASDENPNLIAGHGTDAIGNHLARPFFLIPQLCRRVPLSPWTMFFVTRMAFFQVFLALQNCRRDLAVDSLISFQEFASALQPKRSWVHCQGISYERLEFLGDAVLKLLISMSLYIDQPYSHEGILTSDRDALVSNSFLCERAQSHRMYNVLALTGSSVKVKAWPWYLAYPSEKHMNVSRKLLADSLEALIGLYYTKRGLESCVELVQRLGIRESVGVLGTSFVQPARRNAPVVEESRVCSPRLAEVERIIGYVFKRKEVLVEALTHASYRHSAVGSYQRLEFLGDAVVGFIILKGFFFKYPDLDPAQLTSLREPGLSNDLFGRAVLQHKLHKHLWHSSKALSVDIAEVESVFASDAVDDEDALEDVVLPKVLGDILEAIIGAVVVDEGMRVDAACKVAERLLSEELERCANPDTVAGHPVTKISQVLQARYGKGPEFVFKRVANKASVEFRCDVEVNGVSIGCATGLSHRKSKKSAAIAALGAFQTREKAAPQTNGVADCQRASPPAFMRA